MNRRASDAIVISGVRVLAMIPPPGQSRDCRNGHARTEEQRRSVAESRDGRLTVGLHCWLEHHDSGTCGGYCQVSSEIAEAPGSNGKVRRLRVLSGLGTLMQHERKSVTQHQCGGYGKTRSLIDRFVSKK